MIKHKDHFHGSDLEKIEEIYGIKKEEIVSFIIDYYSKLVYNLL